MREIRPSGSEGGVVDNGHLYPYQISGPSGPNLHEAGSPDPAFRKARRSPRVGSSHSAFEQITQVVERKGLGELVLSQNVLGQLAFGSLE
jgi:hypothetical protein